MILPLLTVILTCTGPQRVLIESPVTVLVVAALDDPVAGEGEVEGEDVDGADVVDGAPVVDGSGVDGSGAAELELTPGSMVLTAAGRAATGAWVLNDNNPTNPAMVPKIASSARRIRNASLWLRTRRIRDGSAGAEPWPGAAR